MNLNDGLLLTLSAPAKHGQVPSSMQLYFAEREMAIHSALYKFIFTFVHQKMVADVHIPTSFSACISNPVFTEGRNPQIKEEDVKGFCQKEGLLYSGIVEIDGKNFFKVSIQPS